MKQESTAVKVLTLASFVIMVTVNALANALPINGIDTGQVSDSYPNLFAPTGLTFAIWGVIYLLLAGFTLYVLGLFRDNGKIPKDTLQSIAVVFSVSSLVNAVWIFAWHYRLIGLSLILMLIILLALIWINQMTKTKGLSERERWFVRLPFSVYFGWITVATVANVTTWLVDVGWNGFGVSEATWMILITLVAMLIGTTVMWTNRDLAYGLVLLWAYLGILIKHVSEAGFAGQYGLVIATVIACMVVFAVGEGMLLHRSRTT